MKYNYQEEINKTYAQTFKEYGVSGALKAGIIVIWTRRNPSAFSRHMSL